MNLPHTVHVKYLKMATLAKNGVSIKCFWPSYLEPTLEEKEVLAPQDYKNCASAINTYLRSIKFYSGFAFDQCS